MSAPAAGPLIAGEGTPEAAWAGWSDLHALPPWSPPAGRIVVVAPHPDDEVLGVGGLLALHAAAGREVLIVAVTDGDASHPHSVVITRRELAAARRREQRRALVPLGLAGVGLTRLGLPDGAVSDHEATVTDRLTGLLRPGDCCLATWEHDGHPDHEAVGRAARRAADLVGVAVLAYPVWTWHWARPADPRVPWARARQVPLPAHVLAAKKRAVAAYTTQVRPLGPDPAVLPAGVLARLLRPFEVVLT